MRSAGLLSPVSRKRLLLIMVSASPGVMADADRGAGAVWSHRCGWEDFLVRVSAAGGRRGLGLDGDWASRWTVAWRSGRSEQFCSVRDLVREPSLRSDPIRGFSWKRDQGHRPGLTFMVSTGRHHGAESTEEARVLLALDFAANVTDVVSQPFRLRFDAARQRVHTPDFLVETPGATWLLDVRPEPLIEDKDLESFAAAAEMALACGWHYRIAAGWRENAWAALDAFSSQRRRLPDPLGLRPGLLAAARQRRATFGELAAASGCEPVARAQLLHLLWHRRIGVDLSLPLADSSPVACSDSGDLR